MMLKAFVKLNGKEQRVLSPTIRKELKPNRKWTRSQSMSDLKQHKKCGTMDLHSASSADDLTEDDTVIEEILGGEHSNMKIFRRTTGFHAACENRESIDVTPKTPVLDSKIVARSLSSSRSVRPQESSQILMKRSVSLRTIESNVKVSGTKETMISKGADRKALQTFKRSISMQHLATQGSTSSYQTLKLRSMSQTRQRGRKPDALMKRSLSMSTFGLDDSNATIPDTKERNAYTSTAESSGRSNTDCFPMNHSSSMQHVYLRRFQGNNKKPRVKGAVIDQGRTSVGVLKSQRSSSPMKDSTTSMEHDADSKTLSLSTFIPQQNQVHKSTDPRLKSILKRNTFEGDVDDLSTLDGTSVSVLRMKQNAKKLDGEAHGQQPKQPPMMIKVHSKRKVIRRVRFRLDESTQRDVVDIISRNDVIGDESALWYSHNEMETIQHTANGVCRFFKNFRPDYIKAASTILANCAKSDADGYCVGTDASLRMILDDSTRGLETDIVPLLRTRQKRCRRCVVDTQKQHKEHFQTTDRDKMARIIAMKYRRHSEYAIVWARIVADWDAMSGVRSSLD